MEPFKNPLDGVPKQRADDLPPEERNAVRARLMAYCDAKRIGVPTLVSEIERTTGYVVAVSTLQRFMGDKHRTNQRDFEYIRRFVLMTSANEPLDAFGRNLMTFYPRGMEEKPGDGQVKTLAREWGVTATKAGEKTLPFYSKLNLEPVPDGPFLRARESVRNRLAVLGKKPVAIQAEGVALHRPQGLYIVMREVATRTERYYWLRRSTGPDSQHAFEGLLLDRVLRAPFELAENITLELQVTLTAIGPATGPVGEVPS